MYYNDARGIARVHCAVSPQNFGISREQARVLNLDWGRLIVVSFEFGTHYTVGLAPPNSMRTYMSRFGDSTCVRVLCVCSAVCCMCEECVCVL